MTDTIKLTIDGLNSEDDTNTCLETTGQYFFKNGSHYILFEETDEDGHVTKSRIKIKGDCVEVLKQGSLRTLMIFEKNKIHTVDYQTPFGMLRFDVDTKEFFVEIKEDTIKVEIDYTLLMGGEPMNTCHVSIKGQAI